MRNADLVARDLAVVWHPCTQMKDHESVPLLPIVRGRGVWLEDADGRRYLDAISSWWTNLFGHAHPAINAALKDQLDALEHVLLAGCTHAPVIELSERLVALAPQGLTRAFYCDNGSSAIEAALKMSFHYWLNVSGRPDKRRFVTLANSYHGETLGALAVGDVALFKQTYAPLIVEALTVPSPDAYLAGPGETALDCARRAAAALDAMLAAHAGEIAALIVEPLVQCAGGMRMHDPEYLRLARAACDRHGVHLIADEIAVGFGRTGTLFACEQAGITPDFLCLSKGLTGGYLPMSVVLTGDDLYRAFYDDYGKLTAFLHSHSYTGNPLAARAALATLDLFAASDVLGRNRELAAHMARLAEPFRTHPHIGDVRQRGMILAFEMVADPATRTPYPWQQRRGLDVYRHALDRGALLRPLGNVVYFMPPYVITEAELDRLAEIAWECIELVTLDPLPFGDIEPDGRSGWLA
ncbi:adenosylmethionine--8-amino-7-oxononanoate transaminase [Plasticicumulans sp.]|uniref:adenosylmethionine--8-amino-7-oxononanoate transaminase n=1 Tax=Plasticicumulans sp. TaxID=2307179 RepID=UPI003943141C